MDRRLEAMVNPAGRLRDMGPTSVVKMLRLFNLCDLGTAAQVSPPGTAKVHRNPGPPLLGETLFQILVHCRE